MVKMVKKLKKYKNLRISVLKSEPVPPFTHTTWKRIPQKGTRGRF